jgi:hypothetical protein
MSKIVDYLVNERGLTAENTERITSKLASHEDILAELEQWIDTKVYPTENSIEVEGYAAKAIATLAPFMDGVGVYNFLVTLRERPEAGKKIIKEGFPRK